MISLNIVDFQDGGYTPYRAHDGDAGLDLRASQEVLIPSGACRAIPTGLGVEIPYGYVGLIHPRSGLAAKSMITVLNAPGTIDFGYEGELKVLLMNHHPSMSFRVSAGDRIAQLLVQKVELPSVRMVTEFDGASERGVGGFGSTGVAA